MSVKMASLPVSDRLGEAVCDDAYTRQRSCNTTNGYESRYSALIIEHPFQCLDYGIWEPVSTSQKSVPSDPDQGHQLWEFIFISRGHKEAAWAVGWAVSGDCDRRFWARWSLLLPEAFHLLLSINLFLQNMTSSWLLPAYVKISQTTRVLHPYKPISDVSVCRPVHTYLVAVSLVCTRYLGSHLAIHFQLLSLCTSSRSGFAVVMRTKGWLVQTC